MTLVQTDGGDDGPPRVAVLLFGGAELIDLAGPWEVFGTAGLLVHSVAEKQETLTAVFGLKVIPDYTFFLCTSSPINTYRLEEPPR
jgi:hypothetical protein